MVLCPKCNDSGLIPFIKNGKVIPYVWQDCECKERAVEHHHPFEPDSFDFPCSDTFRGYAYEIVGRNDPASIPPPTIIEHCTREIVKNVYVARKPEISEPKKGVEI